MSDEQACKRCRYWDRVEKAYGFCRNRSPIIARPTDESRGRWLQTCEDDWCGDWGAK